MSVFKYPIVAVGASAGGIEALKSLVECIPSGTKASFVILQHLAPDYESQLVSILSRSANLPCVEAEEDMSVDPGHIYVLPPNRYLRIVDHGLFVDTPQHPRGSRMPIDYFMRSLAETAGSQSVGVILSGTGSDGTLGLRAIKGAGGLTFAQSPETALYDGMPQAAIDSDNADEVGTISEISRSIVKYAERTEKEGDKGFSQADLKGVLALIKARLKYDFSAYKGGTIGRRIRRRMNLLRFANLSEYTDHLRSDANELRQLADDMLINVTSFFRDAEVWPQVEETIIAPLIEAAGDEPIRIWVPACSSGEEAYTLAILFEEHCAKKSKSCDWQIFATDLDEDAIAQGREGIYPHSIAADLTAERLRECFRQEGKHYRVEKRLRERVVFAQQNLLADPPFSRLELVSCRNLMIYLDAAHQKQLIETFHFALRENGYLMLGTSETVSSQSREFRTIAAKAHIYQRKAGRSVAQFSARNNADMGANEIQRFLQKSRREKASDLGEQVRRSLLERYAPAGVVIDTNGNIHHYVGPVRRFVDTPEGEPTNNIYDILPAPLRARVRDAVRRRAMGENPDGRGVAVRFPDRDQSVRVDCTKVDEEGDDARYLVTFVEVSASQKPGDVPETDDDDYVRHLENELEIVREDLQTTVEELETSNEELKASHEEAMASNEELQSANEELETSREELQSLNEELVTVNHQLEDKIFEVEKATDDLRNLFASTRLPVLFLDQDLNISSFTASMRGLIELRDGDIGRPFSELATKIDDPDLAKEARGVLDTLQPVEREISGKDDRIYLRRLQPYRTAEEKIGGVVATFTDITEQANTSRMLAARERQARIVADLSQKALATRDLGEFFDEVCGSLREAMNCDFSKVLQIEKDESFFVSAGAGWNSGCVGSARVESGRHSQAGYTLLEEHSVLVGDLLEEKRFEGPTLLTDHAVRSGISTLITVGGKPWGVIGLHNREPDAFDEEDLAILEAVSNIISMTVMQTTRENYLSRERLIQSLAMGVAEMGLWTMDVETGEVTWDQRLRAMIGIESVKTRPDAGSFFARIAPDDRERVEEALAATVSRGVPFDEEFRFIRPDGEMIWLLGKGERLQQDGRSTVLGINADVTERKKSEERSEFMMRELDHRVKNLLAIILSIAEITSRSSRDLESFKSDFRARLDAMARTHSLLADARWTGTDLRSLVVDEVVKQAGKNQVSVSGPNVPIAPSAAQALSMFFHELNTNAHKYGALSVPEGHVEISWRRGDGDDLHLVWTESGGPHVKKPTKTGFGTKVLGQIVKRQLSAETTTSWKAKGMELKAIIRLPNVLPPTATETPEQTNGEYVSHDCLDGKRILVLDDEWLIAEQHAEVFSAVGAEIVGPFLSLSDAMAEEAEAIDLAILDFSLAEDDTVLPLAKKLKEAAVPILFVTGYGSNTDLPNGFEQDIVVPKPASANALLANAARLVSRQEMME
ncbi:Signal Transduction Histidine Kinase (STHK) with CheB and CheR activity [Erythrobacter sp. SD-21]|nr:Signal Transduction Histidine Kinase (STHK) with CheB and CheR activity [Erythrobacter sp. SD-21]